MRRLTALILTALLCLTLAGCGGGGDVSRVRLDRGRAEQLSDDDVRAATDAAMDAFRRGGDGQTLRGLRYDEGYCLAWLTARGLEPDGSTIVLLASWTDADGRKHDGIPWEMEKHGEQWKLTDGSF